MTTDSGRDRVRAVARLVSLADSDDKSSADQAIVAAGLGFTLTTSFGVQVRVPELEAGAPPTLQAVVVPTDVTRIRCGHGRSVGSAAAEDSGCDALDVVLPPGVPADAQKPEQIERRLFILARSGLGRVGVSIGDAVLGGLEIHGSRGAIDVTVPTTQGSIITIVAETGDEIVVRLPRDFAADLITLETSGAIDSAAFPGLQSGQGRGQPGQGARSITVRSTGAAPAGRILLVAQ